MEDRRVLVVESLELAAFGYDGVGSFACVQDAVDVVPLNNQVHLVCTSNQCTIPGPRASSPSVDQK
jgi:hypothetical protein